MYVLWPQLRPHTTVRMGDGVFNATIAKTDSSREQGLSGTSPLRPDQAMIFVFDKDGKWPMWMKDMDYPLDIIWLDKDKEVVYIVKNASPDSYPDVFTPNAPARYVVEVPAGTVDTKAIRTGSSVVFEGMSGTDSQS